MKETRIPKFIREDCGLTSRQWKALKRRQLRTIFVAIGEYRLGCAYCPGYDGNIDTLDITLRAMKDSHSIKNWGR